MICKPCLNGGQLNKSRNDGYPAAFAELVDDELRTTYDPAELHARCEQPTTCPCQHRVGKHVKP